MTSALKLAYWDARKGNLFDAAMYLLPRNRAGDRWWTLLAHRRTFGRWPDLRRPRTGNEHLLRLKLSDELERGLRVSISDKELVKHFVRDRVGDGFTPATLAVLRTKAQVQRFDFPDVCVIKPTHSSGACIVRRDASTSVDRAAVMRWLDDNYYERQRERNYRALEPKVIVEEFVTADGDFPEDFKLFCFDGNPAFVAVNSARSTGMCLNYYSLGWRELDIRRCDYPRATTPIRRPQGLERMIELARRLSAGFSFLRVDFYQLGQRVLVGELTNLPDAGKIRFASHAMDLKFGALFEDPRADVERLFGVIGD